MEFLYSDLWAIALLVGAIAGLIDSIAGGGGLITIPALLAMGLSPAAALATNKLQGSFGTLSASIKFLYSGKIAIKEIWLATLCSFMGSLLGAFLIIQINTEYLEFILPLLLILFALYFFVFSPNISDIDTHNRISNGVFAFTAGVGIGFYDGFFGPGTGSFFCIALIVLRGHSLKKAIANTKLLNLASNVGALTVFTFGDNIVWLLGFLMGGGQVLGAWIGAHIVMHSNSRFLRPFMVVMLLAICTKMVVDAAT